MKITLEQINGENLEKIISRTNSPENIYDNYGSPYPKIQILGIKNVSADSKSKHFNRVVSLAIHPTHLTHEEYSDFMKFLYVASGGKE